jgi:membrane protein
MSFISELLTTPNTQLGRAGRFTVFQIKLWTHCAKLLRLNRAALQAAALSYRTIFGIIPLAIVMLLIFRLFPAYSDIGSRVKNLIYDELQLSTIEYTVDANSVENNGQTQPGKTFLLTDYLDRTVAGFLANVHSGEVTLVSLLIVIWAAIALISTIEKAFNNIWHVPRGRNILQRIINYWAVLTLGPVLLGTGVYIATTNNAFIRMENSGSDFLPDLLSYLVSLVAFFLLYFVLPNTKVNVKPAIWGAAVAALVWALAKWIFRLYVTKFIPYNQLYGLLGLIPLSVFWIYVSWLIVLFGLQLTYTTQHLKSLDAAEIASAKKNDEYFVANDITAINIIKEVAHAFQNNQPPIETETISGRLDVPADLTEKILRSFVNSGIIVKTTEPKAGYVLAGNPENISIAEISQSLSKIGFAQDIRESKGGLKRIMQASQNTLAQYNLKQLLESDQVQ